MNNQRTTLNIKGLEFREDMDERQEGVSVKKMLGMILVLMSVLINVSAFASGERTAAVQVGDTVTFGRYPQTATGMDRTPIEWIVLEVKDGKAMLLSKYGLYAMPYERRNSNVTWEKCGLRSWLNGNFMYVAFSPEEQAGILLTEVDNSVRQQDSGWTEGGNNTMDRVFLLGCAEAAQYFNASYIDDNLMIRVRPTDYALENGAGINSDFRTEDGADAGWWWLRSHGGYEKQAGAVTYKGHLSDMYVDNDRGCVRPVLWIDLEAGVLGSVTAAEQEPFTFLNGARWGMSSADVIALEDREYHESERDGVTELTYYGVHISKYTGLTGYRFTDDRLTGCVYMIDDPRHEAYSFMQKKYNKQYGDAKEPDEQAYEDFFRKSGMPGNAPAMSDIGVCRWELEDGTQVWMLGIEKAYSVYIFYMAPED